MVEIKFCGMTRAEDVRVAVALGARYVGVIFAPSPRRVSAETARDILAPLRDTNVTAFGVFSDEAPDGILAASAIAGLGGVQVHGWGDPVEISRFRQRFDGEVWTVRRVGSEGIGTDARGLFESADGVVLDSYSSRGLGGTGERFDWRASASLIEKMRGTARLIVAGGVRAHNVREVIELLAPDVVDVSSGVEASPGVKDAQQMRAFVDAVRACAIH